MDRYVLRSTGTPLVIQRHWPWEKRDADQAEKVQRAENNQIDTWVRLWRNKHGSGMWDK
jgi:hypothetical protein